MGISRRNPRGNFNWQSRYLKKKAICCGELNEPIDCSLFPPILGLQPTKFCISDPPQNLNIICQNSALNQFFDNTFELYKDAVLIDQQFVPFGAYTYTLAPATIADGGFYEVKVTNRFGCEGSISAQIDAYEKPYFTVSSIGSTIVCEPPVVGDGEITLTVDNPVPGYIYAFSLCYDLGAGAVCDHQSGLFTSYTFTGLCNIRYIVYVGIIIPGGSPTYGECTLSEEVNLVPPVSPPVANFSGTPTTIYAGDTVAFTDLSTNTPTAWSWAFTGGTPATSVTQNPSVVYNTAGTYGVDLTASNIAGSDLESKPNYITVNFPYLLDIYGNAAAAYSVRKLRSAYAGSCLRVRRSSDNTELNIGFVNNFLDTAALTTFVGVGSGFVTKWYDQSGNGRDGIQTSAFNQPRIVNAGVLFTQNSLASINCYDNNRCAFNITEGGFGGNTILTNKSYGYAFVAARTAQTTATRRTLFSIASTNINSSRFYIGAIASSNAMAMGGKRLDTDTLESTSTTTHGSAFNLLTGVARYADAEAYLYKNGVLAGSKVPFQTAGATSNTGSYGYESYIGSGRGDVAGGIENGSVSEVVIYNTDKASDRAAIETNIMTYYSI